MRTEGRATSRPRRSETVRVERGSGNVFEDLGLRNSATLLAKADLAAQICAIVKSRGLSQVRAAEVLGVSQPKVSALIRGNLDGFSYDRLFRFLNALGHDVQIVTRPRRSAGEVQGIRVRRAKKAS